jgi:hypothetical protein
MWPPQFAIFAVERLADDPAELGRLCLGWHDQVSFS